MNGADTNTGGRPPEAYLVGPLVCKIVLLSAALAGGMALLFSRLGGCDWIGSVWRTAVAATVVAFFGGLLAGPLQRAIMPAAKKENTSGEQVVAPGGVQPAKQP